MQNYIKIDFSFLLSSLSLSYSPDSLRFRIVNRADGCVIRARVSILKVKSNDCRMRD